MAATWRNWSGSVRFRPARRERPRDEAELASIVRDAHANGRKVRAVGSGHTSNDMLVGDDVLVEMRGMAGVVSTDRAACEAVVRPGTTLEKLGRRLYEADLALPNYGDVATQTIGGAIGTGTHGTGRTLQNLSQLLVAVRLVDGTGAVRTIARDELERVAAARVALGTLGVFSEITLRLVPAFDVERREYAAPTEALLERLDALLDENRSVDFYWYPRRDDVKVRLVNPVGGGTRELPWARLLERTEGYGHTVIPTHSGIPHRFEESEYAMPAAQGVACFRAVRARVLARWRHVVGWRVLYRTLAGDGAYLSPAYERDSVTISLHQNSSLPWRAFFDDVEPIFLGHGGRPHWAKKHNRRGADLAAAFPRWNAFHAVRRALDPDGTFETPHVRALFGLEDAA